MEITNVHKTFGKLFFECSDFCIGIILHEVRRIPHWVPSLDYGKCFTYRGLIFGLAHEFSHNLISHFGMYTNEKSGSVPCRFVRGVHQGQFTTISFKHSLLQWLLMYKEEGFLSSSRSWFIFFVNDSVSGSVKEVAFGRLSLPLVYPMLLGRNRLGNVVAHVLTTRVVSPICFLWSSFLGMARKYILSNIFIKRPLQLRKVGYVLVYKVVEFVNYTFIDVLSDRGQVPYRVVDMREA